MKGKMPYPLIYHSFPISQYLFDNLALCYAGSWVKYYLAIVIIIILFRNCTIKYGFNEICFIETECTESAFLLSCNSLRIIMWHIWLIKYEKFDGYIWGGVVWATLAVIKTHFWYCIQGSLLAVFGRSNGMPGIKTWSTKFKALTLLAVLSHQLLVDRFLKKLFLLQQRK